MSICPHERIGVKAKCQKECACSTTEDTFFGMALDATLMQARLSLARIESILPAVKSIWLGQSLTVKQFQRLLGLMAAASNVIAFGLLYMRHMQWWLRTKGLPRGATPFHIIKITWRCFVPSSQGPMLGA